MAKTVSRSKRSDYISFLKIRLATLVVFSAAITYILSSWETDSFSWYKLICVVIGGFLITGASNGLNQISEIHLDAKMKRTENRPVFAVAFGPGGAAASAGGVAANRPRRPTKLKVDQRMAESPAVMS